MLKTNALRITIGLFIACLAAASSARAEPMAATDECACACSASKTGDSTVEVETTDDTAISHSRLGARFIEAYASLSKRNKDRLSSLNYGIEYNQPVADHFDVNVAYEYSHLQDFRRVYANSLDLDAIYYRSYGKFKPFAGFGLGAVRQWTDYDYAYWGAFGGVEYIPVEKLVLSASAGLSDTFTAGDNLGASAGASAIYWLLPAAGPYYTVSVAEGGFVAQVVGVAARYRF